MISTAGLDALRRAATLVAALPSARLKVRDGDGVFLEVRRPPFPECGNGRVVLPPCAFRKAVGRAHHWSQAGQRLAFMGLPEGQDPAVDIGLPVGDSVLAGDVYRVRLDGSWVHVFATTLEPSAVRRSLADHTGGGLGVRHDPLTEVTLVEAACAEGDDLASAVQVDALHAVLAHCATRELLESVGC